MAMEKNYDIYKVSMNYDLSSTDNKVLAKLYLPIIGSDAYSLYTYLACEAIYNSGINEIEQLLKNTGLSNAKFLIARETLEATKLLHTYQNSGVKFDEYIFKVSLPLDPAKFFSNGSLLLGLLETKMDKRKITELKSQFKIGEMISEDFKDISASFSDVFQIDDSLFTEKDDGVEYISKEDSGCRFNIDEFILSLKKYNEKFLMFNKDSITSSEAMALSRAMELYGLTYETLVRLFDKSTTVDNVFSTATFTKELYMLLPAITEEEKNNNDEYVKYLGDSAISKKIKAFAKLTPNVVLDHLFKGELMQSDYDIIEELSNDFKFSNGVINVLLDRTLTNTNGNLNRKYILSLARSLVYNNITSDAYDAYYFFYRADFIANKKNRKIENIKVDIKSKVKNDQKNSLDDEYSDIDLSDLEVY